MADAAPVLPDLLAPGLRLVLCGSAVSAVSAKVRAPYAGPGNKFWPVLHEAGITPRRFQPSEWQRLLKLGIGLTDINKQESGADSALSAAADDPDALARKIEAYRPKWLAFTAKRPAQVFFRNTFGIRQVDYGPQDQRLGETRLFVLPSPSGLAIRYWDSTPWHDLGRHIGARTDEHQAPL